MNEKHRIAAEIIGLSARALQRIGLSIGYPVGTTGPKPESIPEKYQEMASVISYALVMVSAIDISTTADDNEAMYSIEDFKEQLAKIKKCHDEALSA